ncbi:hypothetical protein HC762_02005, partial [bacterium]|nr:hypothetical protein [bacterium]
KESKKERRPKPKIILVFYLSFPALPSRFSISLSILPFLFVGRFPEKRRKKKEPKKKSRKRDIDARKTI